LRQDGEGNRGHEVGAQVEVGQVLAVERDERDGWWQSGVDELKKLEIVVEIKLKNIFCFIISN